jgi:single-stranded-DNA-specific exonuclease
MMHAPAQMLDAPPALRGLLRMWRGCSQNQSPVTGASRPTLVDRVLAARGLGDPESARLFLEPKLSHLHDPSLIPDMDRAAERLLGAARAGQPIVIYGDYDVDGITATAILWHILRAIAPDASVSTYVPHRIDEGYGLSSEALVELARAGAKVVVSVDCGITAREPARAARDAGLDLIITDHHNPPATMDDLPDAFAVVHPRRPDSPYPFGELSGAGVAYKLAWRLATMSVGREKVGPVLQPVLIELLAFAALGTIADIVPLIGENRVLAHYGLGRIQASGFGGLRALVEAAGLDGASVDSYDVGFKLAPRLNACGRLGHAKEAVELFTVASGERAREIATELTRLNNQRRATERRITDQAEEMVVAAGLDAPENRAIVLAHADWHQGVIGIVCSRLVERFGRPTILLAGNGADWHGSGRSIPGFSLAGALAACAEHLLSHGGHDMAAGLRVSADRLVAFTEAFTLLAGSSVTSEQMLGSIDIDTDAHLDELTPDCVRALDRLAPVGQGNPPVRVRLTAVTLVEAPAPFGAAGKHIGLRVRDGSSARVARLVGWNWAQRAQALLCAQSIDAVVTPKLSTWDGRTTVEPLLHDLRVLSAPEP